ncbi:GNAT family N-acetyltransferase [Vibrio gangliei]|uniref:GNAT family N-acetyltransferase n=1 Tax=Vibrio gangliei TaxID=2077090 RepID=UPI000D018220|nr:GNAT family N-acetyltransferase [Vibrio gangliei]
MSINIRKATKKDAETISQLIVFLTKKYVCPTCDESVHETLLNSMSPESVEKYLSENHYYVVATTPSGEIVGVAGIRDNVHLYHLFVSDNYQGKGLSRKLWESVKKVALDNGNNGHFTVNSAINAESVYLKFGFKRIDGVRHRAGMVDIPMVLETAC